MTTKTKPATKVSATARPKAPKTPSPSTAFTLFAPDAQEVFLVGDFNDWRPNELKARKFKDGTWRKSLPLKSGVYQYLFRVDGHWWTDPANPSRVQSPFGSENSVIEVA